MAEKLTATVQIKLTPSERKALDILAQQEQRTKSDFVRQLLLPKLKKVDITADFEKDLRVNSLTSVLSADEKELLLKKAKQANRTPAEFIRTATLDFVNSNKTVSVPAIAVRRSNTFGARFSDTEIQAVNTFAKENNMSINNVLRMCIYA